MDKAEIDNLAKKYVALELERVGAVKFGSFKFKSGVTSPIYMDLRLFVSYPRFLREVVSIYSELLFPLKYDLLVGIPYAALPITSAISLAINKPWIFPRKEVKSYGTKKSIEGIYKKGDKVVLIDDVITKGDSKIESIKSLSKEGLVVTDCVVLINYQKGAKKLLKKHGVNLHYALTMKEIVNILQESDKINAKQYREVVRFLDQS